MPNFDGIEVSILVNGRVLKEYDDDEGHVQETNIIAKYVEATSNSRFGIRILVTKELKLTSDLLGFGLLLDGLYVDDVMITREDLHMRRRLHRVIVEGVSMEDRKGNCLIRYFKFSELKRVEDSSVVKSPTSSASLNLEYGTVAIHAYRAKLCGPTRMDFFRYDILPQTARHEVVSEKTLKGRDVTHNISLGKPQREHGDIDRLSCKYMDGKNHPIAIFRFKYRSKRALQDLLVRPMTPGPVPLEERPVEQLTVKQMREIIRRQQSRRVTKGGLSATPEPSITYEEDSAPLYAWGDYRSHR